MKVHVVPAMRSSEPSGRPVGYVLEFANERSVYHEGDTWIPGFINGSGCACYDR